MQQLMLVAWKAGDKAKCREVCAQFIEKARASGDSEMKSNAAEYPALFPGLWEDHPLARDLLQQALQEQPEGLRHRQLWALHLFRDGRFAEATEEARHLRARSLTMRNASSLLFLQAMLAQQRGDTLSARRVLDLGKRRLTEATEDRAQPWPTLVTSDILREEAEALIGTPDQPFNPGKSR